MHGKSRSHFYWSANNTNFTDKISLSYIIFQMKRNWKFYSSNAVNDFTTGKFGRKMFSLMQVLLAESIIKIKIKF